MPRRTMWSSRTLSDPDSNDLTVRRVNGQLIESNGLSTATLPSGAVVTAKTEGDFTSEPNSKFESSLRVVTTRVLAIPL